MYHPALSKASCILYKAERNTNMNRVISAPAMVERLHSAWVEGRKTCAAENGANHAKLAPTDSVFKSAIGAWVNDEK